MVVLYGITIVPLAGDIQAADRGLLTPFYIDDTPFNGSDWWSTQIMKLLLERGSDQG